MLLGYELAIWEVRDDVAVGGALGEVGVSAVRGEEGPALQHLQEQLQPEERQVLEELGFTDVRVDVGVDALEGLVGDVEVESALQRVFCSV